jgi:mRNA interferase MazF
MQRGDVWWLEAPDRKPRPVVVLSRTTMLSRLKRITVAQVTSRTRGLPTEVPLDEDDGMPRPCVVSLDNLLVIPQAYLVRQLTTLGPERMAEVCQALRIAVDC